MSMVTVSTKRNRVYERAFDHDEAQRLRAEGWSYDRIAELCGVSPVAVRRVCEPRVREQMNAKAKEWSREQRKPCRGACGALVWMNGKGQRTGYCPACWNTLRVADGVRPNTLRCTHCGEWKPDDEFVRQRGRKTRRGRRSWCRACDTAQRRKNRAKNRDREREHDNARKRQEATTMANYLVLRREEDGVWREHANIEAVSRLHAVEKSADGEGTYTAVTEANVMTVAPVVALKVCRNGKGGE